MGAPAASASTSTNTAQSGSAAKTPGAKPALGSAWNADTAKGKQKQGVVPGAVLLTLDSNTTLTGAPVAGLKSLAARAPRTSSAQLNARLDALKASSIRPLIPGTGAQSDAAAAGLANTFLVRVGQQDSAAAADSLTGVPGVASAEPDRYVNTMNTTPQVIPSTAKPAPQAKANAGTKAATPSATTTPGAPGASSLPTNYGLADSAQSYLNAGGIDAVGAYSLLRNGYGQLPGTGEIITNVSIGDLTDQSMADAGDGYVQSTGPTTVVQNGQRYLDLPSMPLIPTYVAAPGSGLDATGSTEGQDPSMGEIMLDFGVMSPLPHDRQRAGEVGSTYTDLLGIAPGASYRLVVPQQPTFDQIAVALLDAATQTPRPNVISASLGFGTDQQGFPGRYLEDDPLLQSVVSTIVHKYGEVVSISANDGTRLYTPTSVGADGGSTATEVTTNRSKATNINDDQFSTTPTQVVDSGAITAGGTTLDDTLARPVDAMGSGSSTAQSGGSAAVAETRISGGGNFSSGFGSRVDLSAPSDGILSFEHTPGRAADAVTPVLSGGTSASAPEIAAAAAVLLQAAKLGHRTLTPGQVRDILERTGRPVSTPAQIDRQLNVGPQIDVSAAVASVLPAGGRDGKGGIGDGAVDIARLSLAHRDILGELGGEFLEDSDPARIDLGDVSSGGDGEGLVGPVTFGADVTGVPADAHADYVLEVGSTAFHSATPSVRITPEQLLTAAGQPLVATADRQVHVTFQVLLGGRVRASVSRDIAVGPSDGTYAESQAPVLDPVVDADKSVTVHYDLTGVEPSNLTDPYLVISTVGHWNPVLAPIFNALHEFPLTGTSGTVTLPAGTFGEGGGIYGVGIATRTSAGDLTYAQFGEFAPVRVQGAGPASRPAAPALAAADSGAAGHLLSLTRSAPTFDVHYDASAVHGATSAVIEVSAPAPSIFGSYNTFTNANGTVRDADGFNAGSVVYKPVGHASGTVRLNSLRLGLATSVGYNVRVLATDSHGDVVGQASPSSYLEVDDGLPPQGDYVTDFAATSGAAPAGDAGAVALVTASNGNEVRTYSTTTGHYGAVLAADPSPSSGYQVYGVDAAAHRALLGHTTNDGDQVTAETYDTSTGALLDSVAIASSTATVVAGRVDATRERGVLLLHPVNRGPDTLLPIDLSTGAAKPEIQADPAGATVGGYGLLDLDSSTGLVYLSKQNVSPICFSSGAAALAKVDLDSGTVTASPGSSACIGTMTSDQAGGVFTTGARSFSVNITPTTTLTPFDGQSLLPGTLATVRKGTGQAIAVDGVHHLALVAFPAPAGKDRFGTPGGVLTDSNATSQIVVVDLRTGALAETLTDVNFVSGGNSVLSARNRAIQLDPATRTGWTYGPGLSEVEQFSY